MSLHEVDQSNKDHDITIEGDSQLVVNQLNGIFVVNDDILKRLHSECIMIINQIKAMDASITIKHTLRENNKQADELANKAIKHKSYGYVVKRNNKIYLQRDRPIGNQNCEENLSECTWKGCNKCCKNCNDVLDYFNPLIEDEDYPTRQQCECRVCELKLDFMSERERLNEWDKENENVWDDYYDDY